MKLRLIQSILSLLPLLSCLVSVTASAQNPILPDFHADPSARVFNGKLYVYPSHDARGATNWQSMVDWHVFSTDDMVNWTDHGMIFGLKDITWAKKEAWAPDCIEGNGKYYFYFPADGQIGVAISESPTGPFKDALGAPLVKSGEAGIRYMIDPNVFIDDDGQAYLYVGGGRQLGVVKLKQDMVTRDGPIQILDMPKFYEGIWIHKRNGIYYASYPTRPSGGQANSMVYSMARSPLGPFEFKGELLDNRSHNVHGSITEFKGQWYLFYHVEGPSHWERRVCVERLSYKEDGSIKPLNPGSAATPAVRIAQFQCDRAAAVSYTFDDGSRDQYTLAVPMLNEVGFKGTFFVIPGKVSATVEDAERRKNDRRAWGTITWDELRKMAGQGHEIGSHTWSHRGLTKLDAAEVDAEFSKAYDAIKAHIGLPPLTIAFPFNQSNPEIQAAALKYHVAFRSYQTGVGGSKSTVEWLNRWADQQVRDRKWGVIMAHAIGNGYAAFTDPEIFRSHLHYVKSQRTNVWVDTFARVSCYEKERDEAKLTVLTNAPGRMICSLAGTLDPTIYDVPLTLVCEAPGATSAHAERAGRELPARISSGVIQVDAAPAREPISITWH